MDSQPTTIRTFLTKNWTAVSQLENQFKNNSNKDKAIKASLKIQGLKTIAIGFVQYLINTKFDQNISIQKLFNMFGKEMKIEGVNTILMLGYAIKQQLMCSLLFKNIGEKLNQIYALLAQPDNDSDLDFQIDFGNDSSSQLQNNTIHEPQNFYAFSQKIQNPNNITRSNLSNNNLSLDESTSDLIIQGLQSRINSDIIENQNQEVKQYLYKLSQSTTELSYLCQRMKWTQPQFQQEKSKINQILFSCVCKVSIFYKDKFLIMESQCPAAVSKKQAKRIAALFLLRKIYNRFLQTWNKFKQSKKTNPVLQQPLNANNQQIFKNAKFYVIEQMFKDQQKNVHNKNQVAIQINKYLSDIKSYKAQINVFQGKYNKKIAPVQFQRSQQDQYTLWPVKAYIRDGKQLIEAKAKQASKKLAQEICCKQLLFQIYQRDLERWQQFKKYKKSKNL